jgi:hypothetical protein
MVWILTVCTIEKRDSSYNRMKTSIPRHCGTVFEVNLLHINSYNKHRKRGHTFQGIPYRIYCCNNHTNVHIFAIVFKELHSRNFLKEFCSNFSEISL